MSASIREFQVVMNWSGSGSAEDPILADEEPQPTLVAKESQPILIPKNNCEQLINDLQKQIDNVGDRELLFSNVKVLKSQIKEICDFESQTTNVDNLESQIQKIRRMHCRIQKMRDLQPLIQKTCYSELQIPNQFVLEYRKLCGLQSQFQELRDLQSQIQQLCELESQIPSVSNLESQIKKVRDLESQIQKVCEAANKLKKDFFHSLKAKELDSYVHAHSKRDKPYALEVFMINMLCMNCKDTDVPQLLEIWDIKPDPTPETTSPEWCALMVEYHEVAKMWPQVTVGKKRKCVDATYLTIENIERYQQYL